VGWHRGGLDEQHVAARARHRQAGGHAGDRRALGRLLEEALPPEGVAQLVDADLDRGGCLAGRDLRGGLPQQRAELALEVPDARLAGVLGHDSAQHVVANRHLVLA